MAAYIIADDDSTELKAAVELYFRLAEMQVRGAMGAAFKAWLFKAIRALKQGSYGVVLALHLLSGKKHKEKI